MISITQRSRDGHWRVVASFALNKRDLTLLKRIQEFFGGIGTIRTFSARNEATWEVTKLDDLLNVVIPHFDKYPLQSAKGVDYALWKLCVI
jgi:hypothetical protein